MASTLDTDVEADCCVDSSDTDLDLLPKDVGTHATMGVVPRQPKLNPSPQSLSIMPRERRHNKNTTKTDQTAYAVNNNCLPLSACLPGFSSKPSQSVAASCGTHQSYIQATRDICDDIIEDGAHVVFDWDNTLKLYNKETHQLSCRVSKEFLLHLKHDRHCQLYIISAITPSALNLSTILCEVDRLGLTDVFVEDTFDDIVDGMVADNTVVKTGEYARKGNVIICGYDKAETFLKFSSFDFSRGDKVMFFDDEVVNVSNFSILVPNSKCYLCE